MNMTRRKINWTAVFLFAFIWLGWGVLHAATVAAQSEYPTPNDLFVNDYANVISSTDEAQIRSLLADYEANNGVQMTVLTVRSLSDFNTGDATIEQFATNLFNEWGIGQASRNDGVLFLVAVADRELRIELGAAYGVEFDGRMQRIIDQIIIPYFRQENYSLGIHEGSRAIVADLRGEVYESLAETRGGTTTSTAPPRTTSSNESTSTTVRRPSVFENLGSILLGLGVVGAPLGGLLFARYRRNKPRHCSNCQSMMTRLDERADDAYLDKGQITEENLGSVDYDVWVCGNCQNREVIPYKNWLRRYGRCNNCHYRTVTHSSTVVYAATYSSAGLRRNRAYCNHCRHEEITESVIPMKVRSTESSSSSWGSSSHSSSSSSFGGGRSSGGGASGKW